MFKKEVYLGRRSALRTSLKTGVLVFLGNIESPANFVNNPYSFRQDSTFLYLVGINRAGLAAIIDIDI